MTGARLERAMANPQYREGRFINLEPETPTARVAARLGEWVDADREFRSMRWWEAVR